MKYQFTIHPLARAEALDEIQFLESHREGYGELFNLCIDALISRILENPNQFPIMDPKMNRRKALFGKPFHKSHCIYFDVEEEEIIRIIAVFNNNRNPEDWASREE